MNSFLIYMRHQGLSEKTISEHSRGLVKYKKIGGDLKWDEQKTVDFIKENYANGSSQNLLRLRYPNTDTIKEKQRRQYGNFYNKRTLRRLYYNGRKMTS